MAETLLCQTSLVAQMVKRLSTMWETWVQSLGWEVPWRRKWQPTPVLLPRKFHGREKPGVHGVAKSRTQLSDFTSLHFTYFATKGPCSQGYGFMTSLVAQMVKRLSTMRETQVRSLGWEDPLEKEMAIHSSTTAWKIPWTEEPGRLQPMGSQRVGHD